MASGTFYPAVSGDDGYRSYAGFSSTSNNLALGRLTGSWHTFIRFPNITIPQNSTISSAFIRFVADWGDEEGGVCNINCYFNNVDDAVAPSDGTQFDALALTSAVAWDALGAWSVNVAYDTPELKTILQNIVDRGGWFSGQAIQAVLKDNVSTGTHRKLPFSIDYNGGAKKVELHVTWTVPLTGIISEDVNVSSEFNDNFGELDEDVGVLSEFDDSMGELDENVSVDSGFTALGSESIDEDISVNSELISEHTAEISEDASVSTELISEHTGELSEDASVNSEFVCYQRPANLDAELPMITADILGGQGGFLDATLPLITVDIKSGAVLEASLPSITADLEGKVGAVGSIDAILPSLIADIEGKVETLGEIDAILPVLRASIKGKTGDLATCAATLPMLLVDIQGVNDLSGDIDATLPLIKPYMIGTVERESCEVLRYSR